MLHPTAAQVAKDLSGGYYNSVAGTEEGQEQFQAEVTYDPAKFVKGNKATYPKNGSVKQDKDGILWLLWFPTEECPGCEVDENGKSYAYLKEGWHRIPSVEDIEDCCLSEISYTPEFDEVEPDHPDSWPSLLVLI